MSEFETAVVMGYFEDFEAPDISENAALGQKMPFMDGHYLHFAGVGESAAWA